MISMRLSFNLDKDGNKLSFLDNSKKKIFFNNLIYLCSFKEMAFEKFCTQQQEQDEILI